VAQNLDRVNEAYAAFGRGDIAALLDLLTDDVAWSSPATLPHGGHFSGKAGAQKFFEGIGALWESLTVTPSGVGEAGSNLVLATLAVSGTRRAGGPASYGAMHTFTFRDGKIAGFREFVDLDTPLTP
jgi:ketosteroid isomerase-like protein